MSYQTAVGADSDSQAEEMQQPSSKLEVMATVQECETNASGTRAPSGRVSLEQLETNRCSGNLPESVPIAKRAIVKPMGPSGRSAPSERFIKSRAENRPDPMFVDPHAESADSPSLSVDKDANEDDDVLEDLPSANGAEKAPARRQPLSDLSLMLVVPHISLADVTGKSTTRPPPPTPKITGSSAINGKTSVSCTVTNGQQEKASRNAFDSSSSTPKGSEKTTPPVAAATESAEASSTGTSTRVEGTSAGAASGDKTESGSGGRRGRNKDKDIFGSSFCVVS